MIVLLLFEEKVVYNRKLVIFERKFFCEEIDEEVENVMEEVKEWVKLELNLMWEKENWLKLLEKNNNNNKNGRKGFIIGINDIEINEEMKDIMNEVEYDCN